MAFSNAFCILDKLILKLWSLEFSNLDNFMVPTTYVSMTNKSGNLHLYHFFLWNCHYDCRHPHSWLIYIIIWYHKIYIPVNPSFPEIRCSIPGCSFHGPISRMFKVDWKKKWLISITDPLGAKPHFTEATCNIKVDETIADEYHFHNCWKIFIDFSLKLHTSACSFYYFYFVIQYPC